MAGCLLSIHAHSTSFPQLFPGSAIESLPVLLLEFLASGSHQQDIDTYLFNNP
jgi:hypothetical protein